MSLLRRFTVKSYCIYNILIQKFMAVSDPEHFHAFVIQFFKSHSTATNVLPFPVGIANIPLNSFGPLFATIFWVN